MGMFVGYYVMDNVCFFFGLDKVFSWWPESGLSLREYLLYITEKRVGKCHKCSIP